MPGLYPPAEPFEHGYLEPGDGHRLYWEACGNPSGKPAVVLHGGPGSGATSWFRQLFDPAKYRVVLFDQRNCGRSRPHASDPAISLATNTTDHALADLERLREQLGIERWLVLGGSWGSLLALAYAERFPDRVSELVLFGVATGRAKEADWVFKGGLSRFFPAEWQALVDHLPPSERDGDILAAYYDRLNGPGFSDEERQAAANAWCLWESASPDWPPQTGLAPRFQDPAFALAFARIVTHYVYHDFWLEDGQLLRDIDRIAAVPGVIINGRYDFQSTLENAWLLHRAWPASELVVVEDAGHNASNANTTSAIVPALDRI